MVQRRWCPSRLVSNLLKYWQVVDLRFSIIGREDTAENNRVCPPPRSLHRFPPGSLPDEAGLSWTDVKQGVCVNPLLGGFVLL